MVPQRAVTLVCLMVLKPAMAVWSLDFYTSGCPADDEHGEMTAVQAGGPEDELWCLSANSAHNVVATGIAADKMIVTLFADAGCTSAISEFTTDGCKVIPSNTVIEAVTILPK
ncbi:hypothetical protein DHEL01_v211065 [Diaporthe helianthi]|uniref:Ecp2 effector protein domain-containing protein n=1 Tax=Diaporthe helianthi TaxID=158607 RepID=A0A2P5HJV1_DIAHE|nr:hypothetical protein DHEL01_v211065 [Diaporthe helianthi]